MNITFPPSKILYAIDKSATENGNIIFKLNKNNWLENLVFTETLRGIGFRITKSECDGIQYWYCYTNMSEVEYDRITEQELPN